MNMRMTVSLTPSAVEALNDASRMFGASKADIVNRALVAFSQDPYEREEQETGEPVPAYVEGYSLRGRNGPR